MDPKGERVFLRGFLAECPRHESCPSCAGRIMANICKLGRWNLPTTLGLPLGLPTSRDELAGPLGLDAHIGFGAEHDDRVAQLRAGPRPDGPTLFDKVMTDLTSMTARAFANPLSMLVPSNFSSRAWREAELPAVNGHATARSLARLYGALACGGAVDGVRVLSPESIQRASC